MPRNHTPYPAEFRAQAVELVRTSGKSILEVARELGVSGEGGGRGPRQPKPSSNGSRSSTTVRGYIPASATCPPRNTKNGFELKKVA